MWDALASIPQALRRQALTRSRYADKAREAKQPLVITHPGTGRQALYLGRRLNGYIVGLPGQPLHQAIPSTPPRGAFCTAPSSLAPAADYSGAGAANWMSRCVLVLLRLTDPPPRMPNPPFGLNPTTPKAEGA